MNVGGQGFGVAGFDVDGRKADALEKENGMDRDIRPATAVREFVNLLCRPRAVMLLVPAGSPVDAVIDEITPLLDAGDLIIDSGNSHFKDTDRRGGCIIRTGLLEDIRSAYGGGKDLPNFLLDSHLSREVMARQVDLRHVVRTCAYLGLPAPAFMASLSYFDAMRSKWLPANLIQAQRDYFGAHTYERIDAQGTFHTQWQQN